MTPAKEALAFIEIAGALSYLAGRPIDDCPYSPDGRAYVEWCRGWRDAQTEESL